MEKNTYSIVSVYPDPLILYQSKNSNFLESKLNFTNLTNDYVIFKLYNNQHTLYSVKPSTSFILPKETTKINIKRFKKDDDQSKIGKDKFLLLFYTINKVINDNEEAKDAFKSKLYNENSKQQTMISIILKEEENELESTFTYNESALEEIGDDYIKGIKEYTNINESLRIQSNNINQKIENLENKLKMIKENKELKNDKDIAMKSRNKKVSDRNFSKIILISLILLGLVVGANLARGYNKLFAKTPIKDEDLILNSNIIKGKKQ